jgi:CRISPR-associated protein Cas1
LDKVKLTKKDNSVLVTSVKDNTNYILPVNSISSIIFGPGTSITHDVFKIFAREGCTAICAGEDTTKMYSFGITSTATTKNMLSQINLYSNNDSHNKIICDMYKKILPLNLYENSDKLLDTFRGIEGVYAKKVYKSLSEEYHVEWNGRQYNKEGYGAKSIINSFITHGNQLLYGVIHSAIALLGYLPQLGFIHTGFNIALVCDIADFYKFREFMPIYFKMAAVSDKTADLRKEILLYIKQHKFLDRVVADIQELFS